MTTIPTVLIVEDEYLIALDLSQQLEELGYQCHIEGTVQGALDFLSAQKPAFAVLDHVLWQSLSIGVAERLVALGVPFCVCTAAQREELIGVFAARPLLPKPYSLQTLQGVLTALIEAEPALPLPASPKEGA